MLIRKITTVLATGSLLLGTVTPAAFASTGVGILGNGAESSSNVSVTQNNNDTATQNNSAKITNHIDSSSSTGGNDANFNTDGDTMIQTGNAANGVSVSNTANSNFMSNQNPCGCNNDSLIQVGGNGAFSTNNAALTQNNNTTGTQNNAANFHNDIDAHATTGDNSASDNTGGNNSIFTGSAKNFVDVNNTANKNVMVGAGAGAGVGGTTIDVTGNGALSSNNVAATQNNTATATQNNSATFFNDVDARARTGDNNGDFNTDGNNSIFTGSATNMVGVANIANQNVLTTLGGDCGCATGDVFKVKANGAFSDNNVAATENNSQTAAQNNAADFSTFLDPKGQTGDNSVSDATGSFWFGSDPNGIMTGSSASETQVVNTSNENVLSSNGVSMGGWSFNWDPSSVIGLMGL